jgi:putative FmdB family regulatory protein
MPTYEYICRACTHAFEEFQSIKADPIRVCPKCRKKKVERLIGIGGAVIFKGGGFYETDYRSANYEAGKKAGDEAASKSSDAATASTTASDAKDAKTSAAKDAKTDAKSTAPTASTATSTSTESSKTAADSKSDSKQESSASSDNKRIADRATHPSRIGRGIGNIVKKAAAKKPAAKSRKR